MNVSYETKQAYQGNSIHKNLIITFPDLGLIVDPKNIYYESMTLKESLVESQSIEFVGCIASSFNIQLNGIHDKLKGERIQVSIQADDTEPIPLFNGIVDSAVAQTNRNYKKITAYDELYTKGSVELSKWYNLLKFPITLKALRDSLFEFIGLEQVEIVLPNDSVEIKKQYDPKTLKSLDVIKAVCQINGAFGIINRHGKFEYRILGDITESSGCYPGATLFPGANTFPGAKSFNYGIQTLASNDIVATPFAFYKTVDYEDFDVKPVDKITIRDSEDDDGIVYGSGENNYIIQGNIFAYGLLKEVLQTVARNIYQNVQGFSYIPFKSNNNGLPYIECGLDAVSYMAIDWEKSTSGDIVHTEKTFYVLNREMSGIQALRDNYGAEGEEYQTEFITDLQTQVDTIKRKNKDAVTKSEMEGYGYSKEEIDEMLAGGGGGGYTIESVETPPVSGSPYTLYCVQGEIRVE